MPNSSDKLNVLLIGGGGREHALALAISRSPRLGKLWVTHPSNPGLAALGAPVDVPIDNQEIYRLVQFCEHAEIHLVVIGPEDPLAQGFADALASPDRLVFGPSKAAAQLEADKGWAKEIMRGASVPTGDSRVFDDAEAAAAYVQSRTEPPVIKACGLAKGKGVFICDSRQQALEAVDRIMNQGIFGNAGKRIIVEERLTGPEASVLALVDGRNIMILPVCQDHKRLSDGDLGPNTGGMGAFCPAMTLDEQTMAKIEREIFVPVVDAMRREEAPFQGVLYAGLMLTPAGPKVLEFNVRFGDPECQVLMSRLDSDAIDLLEATARGTLDQIDIRWKPEHAVCVVLASEGYPDAPVTGIPIRGVEAAQQMDLVEVYHAGTRLDDEGKLVTAGGRVLAVTALGTDLADARRRAYEACSRIDFSGMQLRTDIGSCPTLAGHS